MTPWPVVPLGQLVDVLDSRRVPVSAKERASRPGSVPYYGAAGPVGHIDRAIFDEPLILLGEDGVQFFDPAKRKAYLIEGPAWVNNHAHVLRARPTIDRRFLTHFLNVADYRGFANGTTRLKLTQAAMRQIPVPVPDLREQRRIVDFLEDHLSSLDAGLAYLETARLRLAACAEQSLIAALERRSTTARVLDELIEVKLSNGKSVPTADEGFPVLRLTALRDGVIDLAQRKIGAWDREQATRFLVRRNDFLIARGNGSLDLVGRGGLVSVDPDPVAFPDTMIRARPRPDLLLPEFLALIWNARSTRIQIEKSARTTAGIFKVNQGDLGGVELPVPRLADQQSLVDHIGSARSGMRRMESEIVQAKARAAALRRALLLAAFSGRLTGAASDYERVEEASDA